MLLTASKHRSWPTEHIPALHLQCYKHVCALVEKQMAKAPKKHRKNVLYVLSSICRQSKSRLGGKDKYGEPALLYTTKGPPRVRPASHGFFFFGHSVFCMCCTAGARFELGPAEVRQAAGGVAG